MYCDCGSIESVGYGLSRKEPSNYFSCGKRYCALNNRLSVLLLLFRIIHRFLVVLYLDCVHYHFLEWKYEFACNLFKYISFLVKGVLWERHMDVPKLEYQIHVPSCSLKSTSFLNNMISCAFIIELYLERKKYNRLNIPFGNCTIWDGHILIGITKKNEFEKDVFMLICLIYILPIIITY